MQNKDLLIKFKTMFIVCFPYNPHFDGLTAKALTMEPRREKTGLRDFRPGPTQTGLYKLRSRLEA